MAQESGDPEGPGCRAANSASVGNSRRASHPLRDIGGFPRRGERGYHLACPHARRRPNNRAGMASRPARCGTGDVTDLSGTNARRSPRSSAPLVGNAGEAGRRLPRSRPGQEPAVSAPSPSAAGLLRPLNADANSGLAARSDSGPRSRRATRLSTPDANAPSTSPITCVDCRMRLRAKGEQNDQICVHDDGAFRRSCRV
jgi:hypothetical protein